jgi:hypothetical protein
VKKTNKELIELFKESLKIVSNTLNKHPYELKRDEYIRCAVDNNLPRLNKDYLDIIGGFKNARNLFFPNKSTLCSNNSNSSSNAKIEEGSNTTREDIINSFFNLTKETGFLCSFKDIEKRICKRNGIKEIGVDDTYLIDGVRPSDSTVADAVEILRRK